MHVVRLNKEPPAGKRFDEIKGSLLQMEFFFFVIRDWTGLGACNRLSFA
jgi:hypothetical protein